MGGLKRLQVFLNNTVYYSGQTVSGHIEVELISPKKLRGILVKLKGEANVHWTESESTTDSNNQSSSTTVTYSAHETYFSVEHYVMGSRHHEEVLPVGMHIFPFNVVLPPGLPSSFEGGTGYVRYTVRAVIDRPWKFNHESKGMFTILRPLDLNALPNLKEPVRQFGEKYMCCLCCQSGPIALDVVVPATGFVPGQDIPIDVHVDNATSEVLSVRAYLNQACSFHATSKTSSDNKKVAETTVGEVMSRRNGTWAHKLRVPSVPPSYLEGCKIIDISYTLQVMVHISGPHRKLVVTVPVVIGTVPLVTFLPQALGMGPGPSAPSVPREMDPPSFEEAMHGKMDVREKGETHVSGDMMFAPRYPVYQFNR